MKLINQLHRLFVVIILLIAGACTDDDTPSFSDNLRVLKATVDDALLETGSIVTNKNLSVVVFFSHRLNESALAQALEVSAIDYTLDFDETSSFVTVNFGPLDFDTSYSITLPAGAYGSDGEVIEEGYALTFTTKEFVPPSITLSADPSGAEEGGIITITASIKEAITFEITAELTFQGTATHGVDYTVSAESFTIPAGELSAIITMEVLNDTDIESQESIEIIPGDITNAVYTGEPLILSVFDQLPKLILKGVMELEGFEAGAGRGRAVHLYVREDIATLSDYGIGVANNGGGSDGVEYELPDMPATTGEHILLVRDTDEADLMAYFGDCYNSFDKVIVTTALTQNGDDAIELYYGSSLIETFGDADVSGTGQPWEYTDSWAYKLGRDWIYGVPGCTVSASSTTTESSACEYPFCSNDLQLQGVTSFEIGGATTNGRSIHLRANRHIADLSVYGIGIANNGGGSQGREINLPAISVAEGDHILFVRDNDVDEVTTYFGDCINEFDHIIPNPTGEDINFNGNDPFELYENDIVIETYGDVNLNGTGQPWEWTGSWGFKIASEWIYGGVDCQTGSATNESSSCPYPHCN